ncbi:MAG: DUF2264 domain-containing protein, partial [Bacillota bacterium]
MTAGNQDRKYWLTVLEKISRPVLTSLSHRKLKEKMPVEANVEGRENFTYLEALGRLLAGISPWLELETVKDEEKKLKEEFASLARESIAAGTDPKSPDFMNFNKGRQPVVDAAFLAQAIIRAPRELWDKLDSEVQDNVIKALKKTRDILPYKCNWLLFSAMIETFFYKIGEDWDQMRIDYALNEHENWYLGDGTYGDGPEFHWDYYNSFVIQPMLIDILEIVSQEFKPWQQLKQKVLKRSIRYAEIQERMISPEGTFPAIGRSLAYRLGVFQLLGQIALRQQLPEKIAPAQVRCALTAVIRNMIKVPGTFDKNGWLKIGLVGHQPDIGENYISTGSLYLCSTGLLPLGLPENSSFWQGEEEWTSVKIWSGKNIEND